MPFLANSRYLWRVWKANARASIVREMEFRKNFFIGLLRQILWLFVFIFFIEIIFRNTSQLAGWEKSEVLVILALSRLFEGLIDVLFVRNIMELPELVRTGRFDFHLSKPVPSLLYTSFRRLIIGNVGNIIAGIALLAYAVVTSPQIQLSVPTAILFLSLGFIGMAIYYSLIILVGSLVFFLERLEALWGFSMLFSEPLTVPFDVFPRIPRLALSYLVPLAFIVFVPAQAITGRLAWWQVPVGLGLAFIFLTLANLAWRAGIRRYSSASS